MVTLASSSHVQLSGHLNLNSDLDKRPRQLQRYKRHLIAPSPLTSSAQHMKKQRTVLDIYLSTTPATKVKIRIESDDEAGSDDESISVHPSPLKNDDLKSSDDLRVDNDEEDSCVEIILPPQGLRSVDRADNQTKSSPAVLTATASAAKKAAAAASPALSARSKYSGQEHDPIVLSNDDTSDDEDHDIEDSKPVAAQSTGRPAVQSASSLSASSPSSLRSSASARASAVAVAPAATGVSDVAASAIQQSPTKGRIISSESSCDSSAMSSVFLPPKKTRPPRVHRHHTLFPQNARRRVFGNYESSDEEDEFGNESPFYDESDYSSDEESDLEHEDSSVDSEIQAEEFFNSGPPEDPNSMFSLREFKLLWRLCEKNLGESTEDIESGRLVRQANNRMMAGDTTGQFKAQYGRMLPDATHKLIQEILKVERDDIFVDIGHGIGNAVLQAAYTIGCESRGIEVVGDRNFVALRFKSELDELRRIRRDTFDDPRGDYVGEVDLRHGRLELPEFRDFLTNPGKRTKAFVNNFDGVFAERSAKPGHKYFLDHFIAGLFAKMEPGSVMVTLHPLTLGHSVDAANDLRRRHGLEESKLASFYQFETVTLGEAKDVVSWSEGGGCRKPIQIWVYTRIEQPVTNGSAVFLCLNPKCQKAVNMEPQAAVGIVDADGEKDRLVIAECSCGVATRSLRTRRRVDYLSTDILWP